MPWSRPCSFWWSRRCRPVSSTIFRMWPPLVRLVRHRPAPAPSRGPGAYRHDLDGLRGIAIALVVAFHIWFGRVSGGVDVFLVLSGFFFGGMLLRRADHGPVGVPATIRRTLRRLLPAMVVV